MAQNGLNSSGVAIYKMSECSVKLALTIWKRWPTEIEKSNVQNI